MSTFSTAYINYDQTYPKESWIEIFHVNDAFLNEDFHKSSTEQAWISITGLVKKNLHFFHNSATDNIQKNDGQISTLNGWRIAIVEIGLLATALLLAPMETVIRTVIGVVVIPFLIIAVCLDCDGAMMDHLCTIFVMGLIHTALHVPETAVSAFYSHLANYDTPIYYAGHGGCHILCESPSDAKTVSVINN